ncbi:MAG: hypothetical protein LBT89_00110 [Planctomycetaceae bacterium]|jgi:hypothetical protein|nr:hypothetical protein [Planctomycetaceae bacterium]
MTGSDTPQSEHQREPNSYSPQNTGILVAVIILAGALGVCLVSLLNQNNNLNLSVKSHQYVPPQWITYRQTKLIEVGVTEPLCFAAVDGNSFVTGEASPPSLIVFDYNGQTVKRFPLPQKPEAVTFCNEKFAVAFADGIGIYNADGKHEKTLQTSMPQTDIRSLVFTDDAVFAADTAARRIYKFDSAGTLVKTFGEAYAGAEKDGSTAEQGGEHFTGFTVYQSPLTMTLSPKTGLLHITNPGRHRIETFTQDGQYEAALSWGYASGDLGGFAGCCNPVAVASLADGRTITAEKGVSRVKIYRTNRLLDCVVAGPGELDHCPLSIPKRRRVKANDRNFAVGVLPNESIAVFDLNWKLLRIFTPRQENKGSD